MKITFLGASHGLPEANRRCSCTMIEVSGRYYFIDMGIMAIGDLVQRGIRVDDVQGIFITHMHGDHNNGLLHFVDLINWYYTSADPHIYLPKMEALEPMKGWLAVNGTRWRERKFHQVEPGLLYDDGFLKVTAIATEHIEKSYAYLVEAEGRRVLFTGDLRHPAKDFPEIARERELDLAVCEAAHFQVEEYLPVLSQCSIQKVVINHWSYWMVPDFRGFEGKLRPIPAVLANDGLEIDLSPAEV